MPQITESEKLDRKERFMDRDGDETCKHGIKKDWCGICKD